MLTQDDVKIIQNIVTSAINPLQKGQANLEKSISNLEKGQANLEKSVGCLEKGQDNLEKSVQNLQLGQANLEKGQKKIERAIKHEHLLLNETLDFLDKEDHKLKERVGRIEHHLGFVTPV